MESILDTVKKYCNISPDDDAFDTDILVSIGGVFATLFQIGAITDNNFIVNDGTANWSDLTEDRVLMNMVRNYVCIATKMQFDPPAGAAMSEYKSKVQELEWRIREHCEIGA